jgi:hypothetical protein
MLADGNTWNTNTNGPGLSFYKHRDGDGNQYVQAFIGTRGVWGSNNTDLRFYVNNSAGANILPTSPQMVIDGANGNVGIGTTNPGKLLTLSRATEAANEQLEFRVVGGITNNNYDGIKWSQGSSGGTTLATQRVHYYNTGEVDMGFSLRNDANILYLQRGGNVGIGIQNPSRLLHLYDTSVDPYLLIDGSGANRDSGIIINAGGGERKVVRGDLGGNLYFGNSNQIAVYNNGNIVVNSSGAAVDFTVQSDTQSNMLYVNGSGNYVGIGTATRTASAVTTIRTPGASGAFIPLCLEVGIASNGFTALAFVNPNGTQGTITCDVSGVTYNTTSDRRLKDNIQPISDATDKLMDMKPVTHTWIDNPDEPQVHGFIAQEMQEVVPEAVSGDAESDEMMSMDYGRITPVIVAALQDALNEIKELKERISELENK